MERQKTKWRFQNIALLGITAGVCGAWPELLRAELVDRPVEPEDTPALSLSARSASGLSGGPTPPGLKGSFDDFKMPSEERFWELHGVKLTPELQRGVQRLSEHLIGTSREKTAAYKYCEQRKETAAKQPRLIMTADGIGCLYYRWQALLRDQRKADAQQLGQSRPAAVQKTKKPKGKGKKAVSHVVALNSARDFLAFANVPYDSILKKIEFKSEEAALRAARLAQESPKDCRLVAARAAVLRDMENFLPSEAIWQSMNALYAVTSPCLPPTHEAFEVVNGRLALLHLDRNLIDRAASLLEVTLQGRQLKDENSYLFWRGYIDSLQVRSLPAPAGAPTAIVSEIKPHNTYWDRLIERYPLSLHALVADHMLGNDPYERYIHRPQPTVSAYEGQDWNLENVSHLMAGIYLVKNKKIELERISRLLDEDVGVLSFETAMFRLKVFQAAGQSRSVIKVIWQSVKTFGSQNLCGNILALLYPVKFRSEIAQQASYIDPALIFSLIRQESSFNPKATSPVGARGLMQVMPNTARRVERNRNMDLYDPDTNIRIGAKYLSILRKQHNGDYSRLIASYNAGPNNTKKWETRYRGKVPLLFADLIPFPETRHYVTGLMRHMYWYRELVSHLREGSGNTRMTWSWSLADVIPRPQQFGLPADKLLQVKLEPLPWLTLQQGQSSADSKRP
ncbi:MAG: hypothetical protein RLZZ488_1895 [Pseudomonadota bacterium]|jgi:soluble lytic murein transglycosylase-like protein